LEPLSYFNVSDGEGEGWSACNDLSPVLDLGLLYFRTVNPSTTRIIIIIIIISSLNVLFLQSYCKFFSTLVDSS
jgi:hypothetical protein